jgi:hypothetical protein
MLLKESAFVERLGGGSGEMTTQRFQILRSVDGSALKIVRISIDI